MPYKDPEKAKENGRKGANRYTAKNRETLNAKRRVENMTPEQVAARREKNAARLRRYRQEKRYDFAATRRKQYRKEKAENPERVKAKAREKRRKRLADPEYRRRFNKERREKWAELTPEQRAELGAYIREWRKSHPEQVRAKIREYRAKLGRSGTVSAEEWRAVVEYYGNRCAYCGREGVPLTMDHIDPVSRGGPHTPYNVAPACRRCNCSKHNSNLIEFLFIRKSN